MEYKQIVESTNAQNCHVCPFRDIIGLSCVQLFRNEFGEDCFTHRVVFVAKHNQNQ